MKFLNFLKARGEKIEVSLILKERTASWEGFVSYQSKKCFAEEGFLRAIHSYFHHMGSNLFIYKP